MVRKYRNRGKSKRAEKTDKKGQVVQLPLDAVDLTRMIRDSVHEFAVQSAVSIASQLLEDEVRRLCGERYSRDCGQNVRYGSQPGAICIGGQKVGIDKPRVRSKNDKREVGLETYESLSAAGAMPAAAMKRLVRGVSTRDYEGAIEAVREGYGIKKSSISRQFVKGSKAALERLRERHFDGVRFAAIMVDGVEYAGELMVCAVGIDSMGCKHILGVRQGATENAEVCVALFHDLTERGLATDKPILFVIDGGKALRAAIKRVYGQNAVIQRCQVHKKRNVKAHLSDELWEQVSKRMTEAYSEENYNKALQKLKTTYKWLQRIAPDAAASLHEGMEETLTVVRLGVSDLLRQSLSSTNIIESIFNSTRRLTNRVKRWRDGDMRLRWCAAGLLHTETRLNRIRGYRDVGALLASLDNERDDSRIDDWRKAA